MQKKRFSLRPSCRWHKPLVYSDSLLVFQTSTNAVCRHTPAGMTACVWTSQEATTACVRLVLAAAATVHRRKGLDVTEKTGSPALTAALSAPARYRKDEHTSTDALNTHEGLEIRISSTFHPWFFCKCGKKIMYMRFLLKKCCKFLKNEI